ncbi:GIY-YIG nuclease family protein [Pseudoalteromonas distincta]|uniref:GIY-YIG nuclease family protein n=1 Tax=Pseudoalteromonas distincta TaxID=77608 RepID=UPI0034E87AE5
MTTNNEKSLHCIKKTTISKSEVMWFLYIVETRFGHWYTGITTNVEKRLMIHQSGKGAKNLRGKGPLVLIHQQLVGNKSEASKLEYKLKKLTKVKKEAYVTSFKIR